MTRRQALAAGVASIVLLGLTIVLPKLVLWSARALRPILNWVGGSEGALAVDAMIQTPRRSSARCRRWVSIRKPCAANFSKAEFRGCRCGARRGRIKPRGTKACEDR